MRHTTSTVRVGGMWLAIASASMIAVLALHGPISPDLTVQMNRIATSSMRWLVAHWIAAAGLSFYAVAGLILLTSESQLTEGWTATTAWAVIPVGSLWTLTTAVAEATAVTNAALSGNVELFESWWSFAEGKANGFAFVALAVAAIAGNQATNVERVTPAWSAWTAAVAGVTSFAGWALSMWFGIGAASLVWVVSSILMSAWTFWLGAAIARAPIEHVLRRQGATR